MIVFIPKEKLPNETRVSATPNTVNDLIKAGLQVHIESNAGLKSYITDQDYESKGGVIIKNPSKSYAQADIVLKVIAPSV
jgi:NAD(P) transhydrogenase subunit alpha